MPVTPVGFGDRLDGAAINEAKVAAKLARAGFYVVQSPILERADFDLQTPDLTVYKLDPILMTKHTYVEVKSIARVPSGDRIIVCSEASFARKYGTFRNHLPYAYVFVHGTGDETEVYCLPPMSRVKRNNRIFDGVRKSYHRVVMGRTIDLISFGDLVRWLEEKL